MFWSSGPSFTNAELGYARTVCQDGSYLTFAGARFTPNNSVRVYRDGVHGQPPELLWFTGSTDSGGRFTYGFFCRIDPEQSGNMRVYAVDVATGHVVDSGVRVPPC